MSLNYYRYGSNQYVTDTPSNVIVLFFNGNITANNFQTLYKQDGSGSLGIKYPVTTAKTFYCFRQFVAVQSTGVAFQIMYGDTGVDNSAAAPTNPRFVTPLMPIALSTYTELNMAFTVPAGKYITYQSATANVQLMILGYEL